MSQQSKVAVFDIDGTIFRSSLYIEIVRQLIKDGALPPDASMHFESAYSAWKDRTHVDSYNEYTQAVIDSFEKYLPTLSVKDFERAADMVVDRQKAHTYVYTRDLIAKLKKQNYFLVAISGSHSELVERFVKAYGFNAFAGSDYEKINGHFTGKFQLLTHQNKVHFLRSLLHKEGLSLTGSIAVGDSEGDIDMLKIVSKPIAFNPERSLFKYARRRGWTIVVERKNVVYELKKSPQSGYQLFVQS